MLLNPNQDIKDAIKNSTAKKWQVANALGVAETTITVWMHKPMSKEKKQRILNAIKAIEKEQKAGAK